MHFFFCFFLKHLSVHNEQKTYIFIERNAQKKTCQNQRKKTKINIKTKYMTC